MKKLISILLAVMMLLCGALAEETLPIISFGLDERIDIDLDGDGSMENMYAMMIGVEYEQMLQLVVEGSDGSVIVFATEIINPTGCYAMDMDGDGKQEIILSGDVGSDDYYTWCLNYDLETGFTMMLFADAERGINGDNYFSSGYGMATAAGENILTLRGSQDVLGTWMCSRNFILRNGRFELEEGGLFIMDDITDDEMIWEYRCLTVIRDLPVVFDDGSEGVLAPGVKFIPTQTDKVSFASFRTQDGRSGSIALEENVEEGWGYKINGIADREYFEFIPYAD